MLQILVATKATQGQRANDFCFAEPGELLFFGPIECTNEAVDGECGCHRALSGMRSLSSTTTMKVRAFPANLAALEASILHALATGGWLKSPLLATVTDSVSRYVHEQAERLTQIAGRFPVGAIVERRGDIFQERQMVASSKSGQCLRTWTGISPRPEPILGGCARENSRCLDTLS